MIMDAKVKCQKKLHPEEGKNKAEAQTEENNIMKTLISELYNNQRVKCFSLVESPLFFHCLSNDERNSQTKSPGFQ